MEVTIIKKTNKEPKDLVNDQIPYSCPGLLVIDTNGDKKGPLTRKEALNLAYEKDLDLMVVRAEGKVWVAKLMDYSKFRYDQQKKQKEMKKNQVAVQLKEVRLSPTIDVHDFNTKLKKAQKFIEQGNKVKLSIRFKGRMITHVDIGKEVMDKFISSLGENINIEQAPKMDGKSLFATVSIAK